MPIFQDPDQLVLRTSHSSRPGRFDQTMRNPSDESIRTEFCEGPVPELAGWMTSESERDITTYVEGRTHTSDRAELIERIKRGESPTWVPKQPVRRE